MPHPEPIRSMLTGGDHRSIGRADDAAVLVNLHPERAAELLGCLWDADPIVRMRAADAAEKLSRDRADLLQPGKAQLLGLLAEAIECGLRWHLALLVPRLCLTPSECRRAAGLLETYLEDRSSLVKTFAMQGLYDLIRQDDSLKPLVLDRLHTLARTGTPAMRARCRILLKHFGAANS